MNRRRLMMMLAAGFALPVLAASPAATLPRNSLYQSAVPLTDAQSRHFAWSAKRGQPQIVSMFYSSCKFMCPMLIESAKAIDASLTPAERTRLGFTLISLDPKRDTPPVLARMTREHGLDASRWTLAQPAPKDVRAIAGLLGVRYRALADGEFNHTTVLVLLDADGRIVARTENMGGTPDPVFLAALHGTLASRE